MWVSISYFDQVLGKRKSETPHVLNSRFCSFEIFRGFCEDREI